VAAPRNVVEVIPSATRPINSLRDLGYEFVAAVADIVDNSIAARATEVKIDFRFDGEDSWVRIADNGIGMSGPEITEAMRFGAERDYASDDLGKFGLGLKTASLSQCSRLTVASRTDRAVRRIEARQWNLAHIRRSNRWEIVNLGADERPDILTEPLVERPGTVVLWEKLDRILGYKVPWGDRAKTGLFKMIEQLEGHLAMVFHRFLAGEARRKKKLCIFINGRKVEAWDPFARSEKHTLGFETDEIELQSADGPGLVGYKAYILPAQSQYSSRKQFDRDAGPAKWNVQQGFYIYRADRMIQSGGWSYMRAADEHTKLARAAVDFFPDLDAAFELNVAKGRVTLPVELRHALKQHVERLTKKAREVYSQGARTESGSQRSGSASSTSTATTGAGGHAPSHSSSNGRHATGSSVQPRPGTFEEQSSATTTSISVGAALDAAAVAVDEVAAWRRIKKRLRKDNPEAADVIDSEHS
jgi:hypothetical protein